MICSSEKITSFSHRWFAKTHTQGSLKWRMTTWMFLYFCFSRKPMKLNKVLVPYNLAMAALNLYIFLQLGISVIRLKYSIFCEPCRQIHSPDEMRVSWFFPRLFVTKTEKKPFELKSLKVPRTHYFHKYLEISAIFFSLTFN
jgi:hypothetical protein